jgi:hypothetical protein
VVPSWAQTAVPGREAVRLGCPGWLGGRAGELVGQDRQQVAVAEPARQRLVDHAGAVELGQRDRLGHLAAHPARASGGASTSHARAPSPMPRNACSAAVRACGVRSPGALRVVLVGQDGLAALPTPVPGDLPGAVVVDHGDHDLVAGVADPHPLNGVDQLGGTE